MKSQETVTVETNTRALGKGVAKFMGDLKKSLKAGNPFSTSVQIASAALEDLAPVLQDFQGVGADLAEDPGAEATTVYLTGVDVYNALKG